MSPNAEPHTTRVTVGRIGRAHGIRGDVSIEVRTDDPDHRFSVGNELIAGDPGNCLLIVQSTHWHSGRLLVHFVGVDDRNRAEALTGSLLDVEVDHDEQPDDDDEFYVRHLVGLAVKSTSDEVIGTIRDVLPLPGHDVLSVELPDGREVLVPFVAEIVSTVDVSGGFVVIDPPDGLLDAGSDSSEDGGA